MMKMKSFSFFYEVVVLKISCVFSCNTNTFICKCEQLGQLKSYVNLDIVAYLCSMVTFKCASGNVGDSLCNISSAVPITVKGLWL